MRQRRCGNLRCANTPNRSFFRFIMSFRLPLLSLLPLLVAPLAAPAAETVVAREKIAPVLQACLDSDASWTLEKRLPGFADPLVSTGRVSCAKGLGVVWETLSPFPATTRITPRLRIVEEDGVCTTNSLVDLPHYGRIHDLVESLSQGDTAPLEKAFLVLAETTDSGTWTMTLTPRDSRAKQLFSSIVLSGAATVERAVLKSEDGAETDIRFTQMGTGSHALWPADGEGE